MTLLALVLAACDSAQPTVGVVEIEVRSTPTSTPIVTPCMARNANFAGGSRQPRATLGRI